MTWHDHLDIFANCSTWYWATEQQQLQPRLWASPPVGLSSPLDNWIIGKLDLWSKNQFGCCFLDQRWKVAFDILVFLSINMLVFYWVGSFHILDDNDICTLRQNAFSPVLAKDLTRTCFHCRCLSFSSTSLATQSFRNNWAKVMDAFSLLINRWNQTKIPGQYCQLLTIRAPCHHASVHLIHLKHKIIFTFTHCHIHQPAPNLIENQKQHL